MQTSSPTDRPWTKQAVFDSFEELAETIRGWDLDWMQIDAGPLRAELLQVGSPAALLTRAGSSRRCHQRGASPADVRTFAFFDGVDEIFWSGADAGRDSMMEFGECGFDAVSPPGFVGNTLSFSAEHLEEVATLVGGDEFAARLRTCGNTMVVAPAPLEAFRTDLSWFIEEIRRTSPEQISSAVRYDLEFEIPARLVRVLHGSFDAPPPPSSVRARTVRRALEVMEARRAEPLRIQELCKSVGVSWRTLDYAFRERFQMTPKQYLQASRLAGARRDLVSRDRSINVTDAATRWGFWHLGQFAADYRAMFGELPSQTLRRRRD